MAARYGHLKTVKYLVENGADINIAAHNSDTVYFAIEFRKLDVAKFLIAHEIKLKGFKAEKPNYLVQPNSNFVREISEYWDRCLDEIKRMEEEKIDRDITFYDIFTNNDINLLACYMQNK